MYMNRKCPSCNGTGRAVDGGWECPDCGGKGYIPVYINDDLNLNSMLNIYGSDSVELEILNKNNPIYKEKGKIVKCKYCFGYGYFSGYKCEICNGTGYIIE